MESGRTVILLNLYEEYESLYDALNQVSHICMLVTHHHTFSAVLHVCMELKQEIDH